MLDVFFFALFGAVFTYFATSGSNEQARIFSCSKSDAKRRPLPHSPRCALDSISAQDIWRGLLCCESLDVNSFNLETTAKYLAKSLQASSGDEQLALKLVHQAQYTFAQDASVKAAILRALT